MAAVSSGLIQIHLMKNAGVAYRTATRRKDRQVAPPFAQQLSAANTRKESGPKGNIGGAGFALTMAPGATP
jgi:hypothetical protein